jgi:hypothetical protein
MNTTVMSANVSTPEHFETNDCATYAEWEQANANNGLTVVHVATLSGDSRGERRVYSVARNKFKPTSIVYVMLYTLDN